jgi:cell division protein FtsA
MPGAAAHIQNLKAKIQKGKVHVRRKEEIVGVVDFGSREVRVLAARRDREGIIQVIGHGAEPSRGCITQGVIQDLDAARAALKKAIGAAEKESHVKLVSIFSAINGRNVETFICEGNVKLDRGIVEVAHMREAVDIASREILAPGKHVTTSITAQEWYVDELPVMDPLGIHGQVLKTRVHFARIPSVIADNLINCIESLGLRLETLIFTPLASAHGCLTHEEMELGVGGLDMGRTTTGLAVYRNYRILGSQCFEWGGYHITRDLAAGLHISFEEADELIMSYGISQERVEADARGEDDEVVLDRENPRAPVKLKTAVQGAPSIVDRKEIEMIIHARAKELLTRVRQYLQSRGLAKNLVCGLVLTGGMTEIRNWVELAQTVFQVPCRRGIPSTVDILPQAVRGPAYAAAVGVVRYAFLYREAARTGRINAEGGRSVMRSIWDWLTKYFF